MYTFKWGNKWHFLLLIILSIFSSFTGVFVARMTSEFINIATTEASEKLLNTILVSVIGILILGIVGIITFKTKNRFIKNINTNIKNVLFEDIANHATIEDTKDEISYLTNDLKQLEQKGLISEISIIQNLITFLIAFIAALTYDVVTTMVFFSASIIPLIISKFFNSSIRKKSKNWSESNGIYVGKAKDYLNGLDTIHNYEATDYVKRKFSSVANKLEENLLKMNNAVGYSNQTTITVANILLLGISFGVGIYRVVDGTINLGYFIAIVQLSNYLVNPVLTVISASNDIKTTTSIKERLAQCSQELIDNNYSRLNSVISSIQLHNVGIAINKKQLFSDVSFDIQKGDKVLITAPSGYGKSTLISALNRQIDFTQGTYFLNGIDVNSVAQKEINKKFSLIKQNPDIFNDSIEFNITMGNDYSLEKLNEAIAAAGLEELVNERGLNFEVGENGKNLSGGQLQRIEIARALLANREIILADEATSALDKELTDKIHQLLLNLNKTVIEVAHKVEPEVMARYDKVINLS